MSSLSMYTKIFVMEAKTENLKTWRTPSYVLPSLLFPLMFYLFFGIIFGHQGMDGKMSAYLLGTYGVFGVMGPALFSFGADIAVEKDKGLLQMKQVSPMPVVLYFLAKALTAMGFASVITLSIFVMGATLGDVQLEIAQWLSTWCILLLGTIPFCAMGLCIGLTAKAQASAALVNVIYLPMAFLSGLWIPIQTLPDIMHSVANFMPAYHFAQLVLKVQGFDMGQSVWMHIGVLAAYTVLFTALAIRLFKRSNTRN